MRNIEDMCEIYDSSPSAYRRYWVVGRPLQELMEAHGLKFITSVPIPKTMVDHGTIDILL